MSEKPTAADTAYRRAADLTGKTEPQLRAMAIRVFASMLFHVIEAAPGAVIWTAAKLENGELNVEVGAGFDRRRGT